MIAGRADDWLGELDLGAIRAAVALAPDRDGGAGVGVSEGHGPLSRLLISALVADESIAAERGRSLAQEGRVHDLSVERGEISAQVTGTGGREREVVLTARPVPSRIWASVSEAAVGDPAIEAAVAGREQSLHLQHGLAADWGEPLVPARPHDQRDVQLLLRDQGHRCQHVAALAYLLADAIDADPSVLLRWRGCEPVTASGPGRPPPAPAEPDPLADDDRWMAGPLPEPAAPRPLPAGAVLMPRRAASTSAGTTSPGAAAGVRRFS